ncbi:hypothetical protein [Streptomyces purpureus]|uniref:Uncharacterized protein n=1 Tax=Streptomyces purpureus TaxID=1951 RepID=A0A918HCL9_9ACTN|nr:hypothetical protein [Streptomyces purpureus]GGT53595.1 hypothetical protein GCM10014713_54350 [Streptomyces purpureus]
MTVLALPPPSLPPLPVPPVVVSRVRVTVGRGACVDNFGAGVGAWLRWPVSAVCVRVGAGEAGALAGVCVLRSAVAVAVGVGDGDGDGGVAGGVVGVVAVAVTDATGFGVFFVSSAATPMTAVHAAKRNSRPTQPPQPIPIFLPVLMPAGRWSAAPRTGDCW